MYFLCTKFPFISMLLLTDIIVGANAKITKFIRPTINICLCIYAICCLTQRTFYLNNKNISLFRSKVKQNVHIFTLCICICIKTCVCI